MGFRLLLDTNLLLLLVAGLADKAIIDRHKRLQVFDLADFDILIETVQQSSSLLFLPNISTETSNLARQTNEPDRTKIANCLSTLIQKSEEKYIESAAAVTRLEYGRLGLTDAAIVEQLSDDCALLTTDLDLYLACEAAGLPAYNFNHIREERRSL
jgi:hypothetical protein